MKKPTLILVHGFRGTHKGLLSIAEYLRDDFNVLTPDIPGSGSNPELDNKTLDGYAEWFHNYIKEKKLKKPYVVGHSMGSIIVSHYIQKYPNDVADKVIFMSPVFRTERGQRKSNVLYGFVNGGMHLLPTKQRYKFASSKFLSFAISHFLTADKSQQKRIDALHFENSGNFSSAASFMADCSISMHEQTIIPEDKNVMLCYGQKDRLTNYKLTEKVAAKYSLDHYRFDGAGHLINYERAEQVANEIRRFLTK